jgi:hypothetical protein
MVPKSYKTCELLLGFQREIFACTLSNVGQFFVFTRTFTIGFRDFIFGKMEDFLILASIF